MWRERVVGSSEGLLGVEEGLLGERKAGKVCGFDPSYAKM